MFRTKHPLGILFFSLLASVPTVAFGKYIPMTFEEMARKADLIAAGEIVQLDDVNFELKIADVIAGDAAKCGARDGLLTVTRFRDWTCAQRWTPYATGQEVVVFVTQVAQADGSYCNRILSAGGEGEMPISDRTSEDGSTKQRCVIARGLGAFLGSSAGALAQPVGGGLLYAEFKERVVALAPQVAPPDPEPTEESTGRHVRLTSAYSADAIDVAGVDRCHRLTIDVTLTDDAGEGRLSIDPNHCGIDALGDPGICTRMAPISRPIDLERTSEEDPSGKGRTVWSVSSNGTSLGISLVVPVAPSSSFRLLVSDGDERIRVLFLEPID